VGGKKPKFKFALAGGAGRSPGWATFIWGSQWWGPKKTKGENVGVEKDFKDGGVEANELIPGRCGHVVFLPVRKRGANKGKKGKPEIFV